MYKVNFEKDGRKKTLNAQHLDVYPSQTLVYFENTDENKQFLLLDMCVTLQLKYERIANAVRVTIENKYIFEVTFEEKGS